MSLSDVGVQTHLEAASWDSEDPGTLPADEREIGKITGIDPRIIRRFLVKYPEIFRESSGRLRNEKLCQQWEKLRQSKQELSDAGKRGNEKRWGNPSGGDRSAFAFASASASAQRESKPSCSPSANEVIFATPSYVPEVTAAGMDLACLLKQRVLENNAGARITEKQIVKWAHEAELMLTRDHRTFEEVALLIEWSQRDSFWKTNILSMGKLREKFDQLALKRNAEKDAGEPAWRRRERAEDQKQQESWRVISKLANGGGA
jgi:hypothetical protein